MTPAEEKAMQFQGRTPSAPAAFAFPAPHSPCPALPLLPTHKDEGAPCGEASSKGDLLIHGLHNDSEAVWGGGSISAEVHLDAAKALDTRGGCADVQWGGRGPKEKQGGPP